MMIIIIIYIIFKEYDGSFKCHGVLEYTKNCHGSFFKNKTKKLYFLEKT